MAELMQAIQVREEAARLLHHLEADRARLEDTLRETGRSDRLKSVTGRSSLDRAIASTHQVIQTVDTFLHREDRSLVESAVGASGRPPQPAHANV